VTLGRLALYCLAVLALVGWGAAWWAGRRADRLEEGNALAVAKATNWTVARSKTPEIPELPKGSRPILRAKARLPFVPRPQPRPDDKPGTTVSPADPTAGHVGAPTLTVGPGWPLPGDLSPTCDCQVAAVGKRGIVKTFAGADLQDPFGRIIVTRPFELAVTEEFEVQPSALAPKPKRFSVLPRHPSEWRGGLSCTVGPGAAFTGEPVFAAVCGLSLQF